MPISNPLGLVVHLLAAAALIFIVATCIGCTSGGTAMSFPLWLLAVKAWAPMIAIALIFIVLGIQFGVAWIRDRWSAFRDRRRP